MNQQSKRRVGIPVIVLFLLSVASIAAFILQRQQLESLRLENDSLPGMTNELQRLRADHEEIARLRADHEELERLRLDSEELYRLRNEVHQLRDEKQQWEKDRIALEQQIRAAANQAKPSTAAVVSTLPSSTHTSISSSVSAAPAENPPATTPSVLASAETKPMPSMKGKPWLGFYYVKIPVLPDSNQTNSAQKTGVLVSSIQTNSPAAKAGLHVGDNIVAFEDQQIQTVPQLMTLYRNLSIGQIVDVDLIRQGYPMRLEMQVEDWPQ